MNLPDDDSVVRNPHGLAAAIHRNRGEKTAVLTADGRAKLVSHPPKGNREDMTLDEQADAEHYHNMLADHHAVLGNTELADHHEQIAAQFRPKGFKDYWREFKYGFKEGMRPREKDGSAPEPLGPPPVPGRAKPKPAPKPPQTGDQKQGWGAKIKGMIDRLRGKSEE